MELNTGMTKEQRSSVSGALSKFLADTYLVYLKTQNFHWNITGPEFYSLHILTEKQYEEMADAVDEIAEKIRALGFFVEGTMDAFKKLTSIEESPNLHPKLELLKDLLLAHEVIIRGARTLSKLAEKHEDPGTVDLMARRLNFHEKACWMLRSQL